MSENFSILSPAGYVMDARMIAPVGGPGSYGPAVVSPILPGFHTLGTGVFPATGLSGRQGTIRVSLVTGTAGGSAQAVVMLALSPTVMLGVILNTNNQPYALLIDQFGTTVGASKPDPPTHAAGTPLEITLAWNSKGVVYNGFYAGVLANVDLPGWATPPVAAWTPFVPSVVYVGTSLGGLGLADFTGTIRVVQVADSVLFAVPPGINVEETFSGFALMAGTSSMSLSATVKYAGTTTIAGQSAMTADGTLVGP